MLVDKFRRGSGNGDPEGAGRPPDFATKPVLAKPSGLGSAKDIPGLQGIR